MKTNYKNRIYTVVKDENTSEYIVTEEYSGMKFVTSFVEVRSPNKYLLSELLKAAIGRNISVAQFAQNCSDVALCPKNTTKISPQTFSRILARNDIVRPLKAEVLQAILNNAENRTLANPDSLLHANGFEIKEIVEYERNSEITLDEARKYMMLKSRADEDIRRQLLKLHKESGENSWISVPNHTSIKAVPLTNSKRFRFTEKYGYLFPYDLNTVFMETDGAKDLSYWGFYIDDVSPESQDGGIHIVRDHYDIFLDDLMHPEYVDDLRISFVFQNAERFNQAVEEVADLKVSHYVSIVLIQKGNVVAEHTLLSRNGKQPSCLLGAKCDHFKGDVYEEVTRLNSKWMNETLDIPVFGY